MDNTYNFCFSVNEAYIRYLSVLIQSIVDGFDPDNKEYLNPVNFHVLASSDISSDSVEKLTRQVKSFNPPSNICFYPISDNFFKEKGIKKWKKTYNTYYRLLIPELLIGIKNVLYMDTDMVVCDDIRSIWDFDITDKVGAAVEDWLAFKWLKRNIKKDGDKILQFPNLKDNFYFNAGLFLFNCEKFKEKEIADKCFKFLKDFKLSNNFLADQDALNFVLSKSEVLSLPIRYNFVRPYGVDNKKEFLLNGFADDEINSAIVRPCVAHFTKKRPWVTTLDTLAYKVWSDSAKKSPFFILD